jgi:hypothetical protein
MRIIEENRKVALKRRELKQSGQETKREQTKPEVPSSDRQESAPEEEQQQHKQQQQQQHQETIVESEVPGSAHAASSTDIAQDAAEPPADGNNDIDAKRQSEKWCSICQDRNRQTAYPPTYGRSL